MYSESKDDQTSNPGCLLLTDTPSCSGLDFLGSLSTRSVTILFLSCDVSEGSHSACSGSVSSDVLSGPRISSFLVVEAATGLGVLSVLFMEVGSSTESTDTMRVCMLLTRCWRTSSL